MKANLFLAAAALSIATHAITAQAATETVHYYSEAVRCNAKLFTPSNHGASSSAAAVVLAPGQGETRASIEPVAEALATRGIVALAIDYRGWGECGGFLYFGEPVRWDDRMRFSQQTTTLRIRRLRIDPQAQVIDVRNAITFLQSVPGVDRARIGVWGVGLSGGHAIVTAGSDARVRSVVAQHPLLAGKDEPRAAFAPTPQQQTMMIALARTGAPADNRAARTMNANEATVALAEYKPYWYLEQIPQTTSVLLIAEDSQAAAADSAVKQLDGTASVLRIDKARHAEATDAAVDWFARNL
ncbi:MAG TPA: dienelactone hydrolase family protein [Povalibacter sp.]|uniref:alpha/beta hydrolase n=1 Tax=Povalibacter sp. TaxID=1962978 RepID=UPI002C135757|nr:dienelactone hydrolase family protein [Povalibacter sp.]HMN47071.1 dienelactone hydrolase family protein [Povalibacter sp.]